jgi:hypothetical protein
VFERPVAGIPGNALLLPVTRMFVGFSQAPDAVVQALAHDVINTAKAVAYSGMLMLFPALLVITTLLAQVPEGTTLVGEFRGLSSSFCPPTPWTCCSPTC